VATVNLEKAISYYFGRIIKSIFKDTDTHEQYKENYETIQKLIRDLTSKEPSERMTVECAVRILK
jgi:hypothetical protein